MRKSLYLFAACALVLSLPAKATYYDAETGTFYNYYRDLDPKTGRYLESDPTGLAAKQFSTYTYVGGNPLRYFDPLGLTQQDVDEMTCFARANNKDLKIPDPNMTTLPDGIAGSTGIWPWSGTEVSESLYGGKLTPDQRVDLYDTIVHESWHYDKQPFYDRSSPQSERDAYREAHARTANAKDSIKKGDIGNCGCKK